MMSALRANSGTANIRQCPRRSAYGFNSRCTSGGSINVCRLPALPPIARRPLKVWRSWAICTMRQSSFKNGMGMRILIVVAVAVSIITPACAQTQPTRPSAYATTPTMPSAFATSSINPCRSASSFNPTSPCYSGTIYPSYSALPPFEFPSKTSSKNASEGANSLDEDEAKSRIEAKGYSNVSGLEKDSRGIWRGKAELKDGRPVYVTLDLEGNIYSELDRLVIEIRRPRVHVPPGATPDYPRSDDH
jgi:hypothetical protein